MTAQIAERPVLNGARVLLRSSMPSEGRPPALERDPELHRMWGGDTRTNPPFTAEDANRWYEKNAEDPLRWVIGFEGRAIGEIRLHSLDWADRRARLAVGIFDAGCWGQELGTDAVRCVLAHAFDTLGLHRVDLRVLTFNHRAIACYEKCGFRQEGIEREGALIAGQWESDVMMSILEHEYQVL